MVRHGRKMCISLVFLFVFSLAVCMPSTSLVSADEEIITLNCYYPNQIVKNFDLIMEEVNKITVEKIGARVNIHLIDMATYPQKINMMIASGEPFDVCMSSYLMDFGFYKNAADGAYLRLNELIDEYAPVSKSRVPEGAWQAATVNGNIYGVINYQVWGLSQQLGIIMRQDFVDKYDFDWTTMEGWDDLTPYLAAVKEGEPGIIPFAYSTNQDNFAGFPLYYAMDCVGDVRMPGWIRIDDESAQVFNQYESEEYAAYLRTFRDWYVNGYIARDAAVHSTTTGSNYASLGGYSTLPDSLELPEIIEQSLFGGDTVANIHEITKAVTTPFIGAQKPAEAMVSIGANSRYPEKAMQWIELVNSDDDVWNLLVYGREGIDYDRLSDRQIEQHLDSYNFNWCEWTIGQSYGRTLWPSNINLETNDRKLGKIYDADKVAATSPITGFVFNPEPVKMEIANCNIVMDELLYALGSGSVDPDVYLPQFISRLKDAGVDAIIAEKQAQIDAWMLTR